MYPAYWAEYRGQALFLLFEIGADRKTANTEIHLVDPKTGNVSGYIPLDVAMSDSEMKKALSNPHKVAPEDQHLKHSDLIKIRRPTVKNSHAVGLKNEDYLEHHGIKGQKWGVRRFQNEDGSLTKEGVERYRKTPTKEGTVGFDPELAVAITKLAIPVLAYIGISAYAKVLKNKNHEKYKDQNDAISEDYLSDIADIKKFSEEDKPKMISGEHSREEDMAAINPKFGLDIKGATSNCALCSVAYDFRRRGYDVTAKMCSTGMYSDKLLKDMYENAKEESVGALSWGRVYKKCEAKYPEGSRGMICVVSDYMGGHAMAFEIKNGKMEIYDAQANKQRKLTDDELGYFNPQYTKICRLDDKNIRWDNANIACAELKDGWKETAKKQLEDREARINEYKTKQAFDNSEENKVKVAAGVKASMEQAWIRKYRKEHPNSQLSNKEIVSAIRGDD